MNSRQFYDAVVEMREAQKAFDKYMFMEEDLSKEDGEKRFEERKKAESKIDDEIARVNLITHPNVSMLKTSLNAEIIGAEKQ